MNYQDKLLEYKRIKGLLQNPYPRNCIKITSQESYKHAQTKAEVAHYLISNGWEVYSEANLKNGLGRADLVGIHQDTAIIFEIVESEKKKSIESKKEKYPFPVRLVKVNDFQYSEFKI